ncbi:MAG: hypothetical protein ABSG14_13240 [Verrucomicrobiia bacterium]
MSKCVRDKRRLVTIAKIIEEIGNPPPEQRAEAIRFTDRLDDGKERNVTSVVVRA